MIPESGKFPEEGNGNPLQYSCLENSTERGAWQATVHGVAESETTEQPALSLSFTFPWSYLLLYKTKNHTTEEIFLSLEK